MTGTHHAGQWSPQASGWLALFGLMAIAGIIAAVIHGGHFVGLGLNWAINNTLTFMTTISDQTGLVPITDEESWQQNWLHLTIFGAVLLLAAIVALVYGIARITQRVQVEAATHGWKDDEGRE